MSFKRNVKVPSCLVAVYKRQVRLPVVSGFYMSRDKKVSAIFGSDIDEDFAETTPKVQ